MDKNNFKFPTGLSWGMRGFRIGKSAYGNWWLSIRLPLGFRYMHVFKKVHSKKSITNVNQQHINQNLINNQDLPTPTLTIVDKQHSKIKNRF